jgi:hypothetical protein
MRRFLTALCLVVLALPALAKRGQNVNISTDDDVRDCGDIRVKFDGERAVMATEEVPVVGAGLLRVTSDHNGGIYATGWSGSTYSVQACKAVGPETNASAVRVRVSGNEISSDGPDEGRWVVYFIVRAPRGATLDLDSTNGPISLETINGTINARVTNGPLSLKDSTGRIDIRSTNGPISIAGDSGDVKASATNGPLSVKLAGGSWQGNLDASTKNGPLSLRMPRGYRSSVLLKSNGHGPISCRADDCRVSYTSDDDDDDPREIQLGSGPANIRLSTVNGPVSVKNGE